MIAEKEDQGKIYMYTGKIELRMSLFAVLFINTSHSGQNAENPDQNSIVSLN